MAIKFLSLASKFIILLAVLLIIYGYACRLFSIYFFWESRYTGWLLLFAGLALYLLPRIKTRTWKKAIPDIIGFIIAIIVVFSQLALLVVFPKTKAYQNAKLLILGDERVVRETGAIRSISITPVGMVESSSNTDENYGAGTFNLIIKGEKKYKDLKVVVSKEPFSNWKIEKLDF